MSCVRSRPATGRKPERKESMRPRKVILSVDDNEQVLSVRKFMLETRGYRVISAATAAAALEILEGGGIDLVLCDLLMPQMDGNELVRRMKLVAPELPMMIVSGTVKAFERADAADAFLPKGAGAPLELLERIRMLLARKRGPKKQSLARDPFDSAAQLGPKEEAGAHPAQVRAS